MADTEGLLPSELIGRKRDGHELSEAQLRALIEGMLSGEVSEAQVAALLMAGVIKGFSVAEAKALTAILWESGETLDLSSLNGPTIDKHSTGGVGDGTTLLVAPLVAAAGGQMVKLSGRGLGHTGGTLDKLEAIPGFDVSLEPEQMLEIAEHVGCVVAAQTDRLVPADRTLYALRDLTGTVESTALIASSVMSKKLAAGASTIVLDVKAGDGAFMPDARQAEQLAELCVEIAQDAGRRCAALVTDMEQPLGRRIGNATEVAEAISLLSGSPRGRLAEVALELATLALSEARPRSGRRDAADDVRDDLVTRWERGEALERLEQMIATQGGDAEVCDDPSSILPSAPVQREVVATAGGTVSAMPARRIGEIVARLGAGRARKGDDIDPAVGVDLDVEVGDEIEAGQRLALVHARSAEDAQRAVQGLKSTIALGEATDRHPIHTRVLRG
ncbi:MAG: thymidine phosphorylase [Actinobacteria bacterium]|nr:thymidine phosphorylase [Actinomycetota bacterium]